MIRSIFLTVAAMAPLAFAQEAVRPAASQPSALQMARRNLDAVVPVPVATRPQLALSFPTLLEFPLCGSFPNGPSLVRDGDTIRIRMRPADAPLPASAPASPAH